MIATNMAKCRTAVKPFRNPICNHADISGGVSPFEPHSYRDIDPEDIPYDQYMKAFQIRKCHYPSNVDSRGYLTVYEYMFRENPIIWDYTSGFVLFTSIWKALGNSKANIVRLSELHPELELIIRRVRGGLIKIQGSWIPYNIARILALRTCYPIRYALVPLFGCGFVDECLKPGALGYGDLVICDEDIGKKRKSRQYRGPSVGKGNIRSNFLTNLYSGDKSSIFPSQGSKSSTIPSSPRLGFSAANVYNWNSSGSRKDNSLNSGEDCRQFKRQILRVDTRAVPNYSSAEKRESSPTNRTDDDSSNSSRTDSSRRLSVSSLLNDSTEDISPITSEMSFRSCSCCLHPENISHCMDTDDILGLLKASRALQKLSCDTSSYYALSPSYSSPFKSSMRHKMSAI